MLLLATAGSGTIYGVDDPRPAHASAFPLPVSPEYSGTKYRINLFFFLCQFFASFSDQSRCHLCICHSLSTAQKVLQVIFYIKLVSPLKILLSALANNEVLKKFLHSENCKQTWWHTYLFKCRIFECLQVNILQKISEIFNPY